MRPEERRAAAEAWLALAEEDLAVAQLILGAKHSPGLAAFHAQQAAEKALKGCLAALGRETIPRTHDLLRLAELVTADGGRDLPSAPLMTLAPHAVESRYPQAEPITPQEAQEALRAAHSLLKAARHLCGPG